MSEGKPDIGVKKDLLIMDMMFEMKCTALHKLRMELIEQRQRRAVLDAPRSLSPTAYSLSPTLQPKLADCLVSALGVTSELERVLGTSQGSAPSRTAALIKQLQSVIGEAQDILSGESSPRQTSNGVDEPDNKEEADGQ